VPLDPRDFDRSECTVARTMAIVGERWTLLVLRETFYGVRRFEDLQRAVGCARNVLSARLARLVEHGILDRVPYRDEGQRERHEYRLSPRGHDLFPIVIALMQWGDRWLVGPEGPPVEVRHRDCGARVSAVLRCAAGHAPLTARDTEPLPAPRLVAAARKRRSRS
jgi:DNA-binding HxlR family transcriptional regulator